MINSMIESFVSRLPNLITVFLGIFLEAGPFLLFGVLVSSILDIAVSTERVAARFPRNGLLGLFSGVALGAAAPLCECGTVPIARGSVSKGLPLPAAIGFLLAAPVINPITVAATYTAFKDDTRILFLRIVFGIAVALLVGALFLLWPRDESPLRVQRGPHQHAHDHDHNQTSRVLAVLEDAGRELSSLMVYLVAAATVAALLQVFLPRTQLLSLGHGPLLSIAIMMAIAVVLSTCSSVDAFVALAFSSTFAHGAILAFLLISPVLNLKSGALVAGLFRPRVTVPLLGAATSTIVVVALAVNYHLV
ncbi:MAG: permease [Chloroflexota bacterium]